MILRIFSLLAFVFSAVLNAAEEQPCSPKNYRELVGCATGKSLDVQISEQRLRSAAELEGIARQWQNPELDAESVHKGPSKSETTASLLFNVRLGGKKSAAIDEAKAEALKSAATRDLEVAQARLAMMLHLYRLSHIKSEISIEEESVRTFAKIVSQFQSKPALSPEQKVSLSVFKMATADHELRLVKLKNEENELARELVLTAHVSKEMILSNLPTKPVEMAGAFFEERYSFASACSHC